MSDMRTFWQNQKMGEHTLSLYELRRRANEFQQAMRRKRLWVSSGATIAGASVVGLWRSNIPLHKLGALLLVPPLAYSLYRSYRNRHPGTCPPRVSSLALSFIEWSCNEKLAISGMLGVSCCCTCLHWWRS